MWVAESKEKNLRLVIEHDEFVGYYLYVFEYQSDKSNQDYLYDNLDQAYNAAQKRFGINKEEFMEVNE